MFENCEWPAIRPLFSESCVSYSPQFGESGANRQPQRPGKLVKVLAGIENPGHPLGQPGHPVVIERGVRGLKARRHTFPINHAVQERIHVIRTTVAVVDVVGVFPNIAAEQRFLAAEAKWVHTVWRGGHFKLAVVFNEPSPAGAELACAFGDKSCFEVSDGAEIRTESGFPARPAYCRRRLFSCIPRTERGSSAGMRC